MKKIEFKLSSEQYEKLPQIVKDYFPENQFSFSYLLTTNSVKTLKGEKVGYLTGVMYLAPHEISGINLCTSSSAGCRISCLWSSGHLGMPSGRRATIARTVFLNHFPSEFFARLYLEIARLQKRAERVGKKLAIRLNGTSDIAWESKRYSSLLQGLTEQFRDVTFYDYTKHIGRCVNGYRAKKGLSDYQLTFSYSGENWKACEAALRDGVNVAACFADSLPETYQGYQVISGDNHDLRFLDPKGVIVGLTYKLPKKLGEKGTLKSSEVPNFVIQAA